MGRSPAPPATVRDSAPPLPAPAQEQLRTLGYVQEASAPARAASNQAPPLDPVAAMTAALKLIRNGRMTIEVASYDDAVRQVGDLATAAGGYVSEAQADRAETGKRRGTVTLRVPARAFDDTRAGLGQLGQVRAENFTTQDVTKAYSDLETRLRVKRETLGRLVDLLRNRTGRLSDVLEAEREIARVNEEIEQMEGERRFYDQQVAFSTLALELYEPQALVTSSALAPIREAFGRAADVLAQSVAALLYLTLVVTPWLLAGFVVWTLVRRLRRKAA
jgi:hypothetical protein